VIFWYDEPTMNPHNTKRLRSLIERQEEAYLWGQPSMVTPRLCGQVFGDGKKLIALSPILYRPRYFVIRIDSSWSTSNRDQCAIGPGDWLDEVYDALEDEYLYWPWADEYKLSKDVDREDENSAIMDFSDGSEWSEMKWPRRRMLWGCIVFVRDKYLSWWRNHEC